MNKKDLISALEEISAEMENFLGDAALLTAVSEFRGIQSKLDDLLAIIGDEELDS